ncbi:MAG TPA: ABC transporter permease subunit [Candidatus Eisenbergiella merdipullorum]|uniref:ABC transporter permease subunit n=1 Tax=Candidatus Eisenbergiella merdipullorum TaxID=2838553 RepID=A0A9D2I609_9FIRM|nr:ABC transporter permease subunit [Candidatus Eisenbergiella merdipullorum]
MKFRTYFKRNYDMYLMLLPAVIFVLIFNLVPMYGITLAFKDYDMFLSTSPMLSILKSPWVGMEHFQKLFRRPDFLAALRNTLEISLLKLLITFPLPILFAILLNEVRSVRFQKVLQTVVYLPHFLSWAVVAGIFVSLLGSTGLVNSLLVSLGGEKINFLMDNHWFRAVLIFSDAWKEVGWGSIIYFAAIAGLDQECFEAAEVDGANRLQQIWYIMLPGIMPTIVLMLIMRVGGIMDAGFGQIFAMYNPTVYESADIIGTYVYRVGLGKMDFSMGTAVGLFNSVIGFILVVSSNTLAKKLNGKSIW